MGLQIPLLCISVSRTHLTNQKRNLGKEPLYTSTGFNQWQTWLKLADNLSFTHCLMG